MEPPILFAVALVLALALTAAVRVLALRRGLVDIPRTDRWHRRPVPRLGGVAIYAAFTITLLTIWRPPLTNGLIGLLAGGTAIVLVGLFDDLRHLENRTKLVLLVVCSVIPSLAGIRFTFFPPLLGTPLAILWVLGITNAFNWLDNMDGVAAGVGAIAAINLVLFDRIFNGGHIVPLALILAGSALGFLRHNFPPARIFMGDSGSGFLGFTVATLAVMGSYRDVSNVLLAVLVPAMIAAVPIFDTAMVTLTRLLHRRPLFQGGRDHPAHRLVAIGLPERRAVLLLYGLSALAGTSALAASLLGLWMGVAASVVLVLGFVALGLALADLHIYEEMPPSRNGTPLPAPFQNKKWIALMGLDIALVAIAYVSAYLLRFEGRLPETLALDVARTLPLMLAAKMIGLAIFGAYRGDWRYAGLVDLVRLVQGVSVGSLLGVMLLFMWMRLEGISRAALTIDWLLTLLLLAATRLSVRLVREYLVAQATGGRRALIFGTGEAGTALLSVLRSNGEPAYHPVGFVDDDPARRGALVRGVPVLGTPRELGMLIHRHRVEEVLVVMQLCHPEVLEDIVSACRDAGIPARQFGLLADLPL